MKLKKKTICNEPAPPNFEQLAPSPFICLDSVSGGNGIKLRWREAPPLPLVPVIKERTPKKGKPEK